MPSATLKKATKTQFATRWRIFKQNKRAFYSLICFCILLTLSLLANFIANDKPLFIYKDSKMYFPVFVDYPETTFGGDFETFSDYNDSYVKNTLLKDAFVLYAPIPYSYDTIIMDLPAQAPTAPDSKHWLGTDDKARDVSARLLYGYRISLAFGLILSVCSVVIGVCMGALQGYYGGSVDLIGQRLIEIFNAVPILFVIIIISSVFEPSFSWILCVVLAFSWIILVNLVRAEFLKARNLEYVLAAKAMNVSDVKIMFKHILPNALNATITFTPFIMAGSIVTLSSLDFLGFGMPVGSASLGELLAQGKNNLSSPHLGISAFIALCVLLSVLVFIGEGLRDAFDPHVTLATDSITTESTPAQSLSHA
ncbi:ABC transporter permease [Helicobacter jaachi]|uniref:ABC transporter permease n=1 Tax=Helicobacter jaachi TaxID=1677920 RepID=A0A4U8TD88_9HELI|nr:ABC transporter permease [Helicobacter jaachi]TLD97823.1 ABC transporter permease [Helicobacter jaachi]